MSKRAHCFIIIKADMLDHDKFAFFFPLHAGSFLSKAAAFVVCTLYSHYEL